jgi:hypothetical protein
MKIYGKLAIGGVVAFALLQLVSRCNSFPLDPCTRVDGKSMRSIS